MLTIGPHSLRNSVVLAPMAGVTDAPFRSLCRDLGVGLAVAEMQSADPSLRDSRKSTLRRARAANEPIRSVQIVGNDPAVMAEAARFNVACGADIIDINMGCPAKKVCRKAAGSALLGHPDTVEAILKAVVAAVAVPVTLKIRTGVDHEHRNGVAIARLAEDCGVAALAVHGRTRADKFTGQAEYDTIARIVAAVSIPVLANGDIDSAGKARRVLEHTGAAGVMIGRAAQGRPWLPGLIARTLAGEPAAPPSLADQLQLIRRHSRALHDFYGEAMGPRIARKHMAWFLEGLLGSGSDDLRRWKACFNSIETPALQLAFIDDLGDALLAGSHRTQLAA